MTSILAYAGVGLGYLNVILLFPTFLTPDQFGLTRVMLAIVTVASQFALLGTGNTIIRFFPEFSDPGKGHRGLLGIACLIAAIGITVTSVTLLIAKPWVVQHYMGRSPLLSDYFALVIPFLGVEVLFQVFKSYSRALLRTVVNIALKEVVVRLLTTALLVSYYFSLIDFDTFTNLFVLQYGLITAALAIHIMMIGEFFKGFKFQLPPMELRKQLGIYSLFAILSNTSALFVLNIDVMMINEMIGLEKVAFYSVAFYVVSLINIPRAALANVTQPILAQAWKDRDMDEIQTVYSKSAVAQLTIGLLFFIGIWANHEMLFDLLPPEYSEGKWVLLAIGFARLIDIGFGPNGAVIINSNLYRYETYFGLFLVIVSIILNVAFIPLWGITGAAIATGGSLLIVNVARYCLLKVKMKISPFGLKTVIALALAAVSYYVSTFVPKLDHFIVDLIVRSAVICAIFIPGVWVFKLVEDGNKLVLGWIEKLKG